MKKQFKEVTTYQPNKKVKATVTNTPVYEDEVVTGYKRSVTITVNEGTDDNKLEFKGEDGLAKYVETVEFEDPQQSLLDE